MIFIVVFVLHLYSLVFPLTLRSARCALTLSDALSVKNLRSQSNPFSLL